MESVRFHPTQHKGHPINCDQVSELLQIFERYLPRDMDPGPAISRKHDMLKYAMLYEVMEILQLSLEDDSARWNATPNDVRNYGDEDHSQPIQPTGG